MSDQPKLVVNAASITSGIKAVVSVLTFLGFDKAALHLSAMTTSIVAVAMVLYEVAPHVLAAMHVQAKTTPVDSPRGRDGTPLAPVTALLAAVPVESSSGGVVQADPIPD